MSTAKRNRNRGKAAERAAAKMLSGVRVGILGKEDVAHSRFSIEVKSRKSFVADGWMDQAAGNAGDKIPLVVVHVTGKRHDNSLVILRMADFKKLTEGV